jgi:hypothetical protein
MNKINRALIKLICIKAFIGFSFDAHFLLQIALKSLWNNYKHFYTITNKITFITALELGRY